MDIPSPPVPPAWADELLAGVDAAFGTTGVGTPGWADPHRGQEPSEEEYSRVLDPAKYRILDSRVEAWVQALAVRAVAEARDVPPAGEAWIGAARPAEQVHRVRRVAPTRPGGLALVLAGTLVDDEPFGLDVGVADGGEPAVHLESVPCCGCDACDDGSDPLLRAVDGWFLTVARGGVVHARRGEDSATSTWDGWRWSGSASPAWLEELGPLPDGVTRWRGDPWL